MGLYDSETLSLPSIAIQLQSGWKPYRNVQLGVAQRRQCAAQWLNYEYFRCAETLYQGSRGKGQTLS